MAYSQAKIFQAKFMRQAEKLAPHVAERQKIDKKLLRTFSTLLSVLSETKF